MPKLAFAATLCLSVLVCAALSPAEEISATPDTLGASLDGLEPGDTLLLADGVYRGGVSMQASGTKDAPITVKAVGSGAVFDGGERDGFVVNGSWVVVEGIRFRNAGRSGISVLATAESPSEHVTIRDCVFADNGMWGLVTSHTNHITVENCEAYGSRIQHGMYIANSGDDPIVRGNRIHDNNMCGLHINGDPECGGDGIISRALVERNVIWGNGRSGGSAVNCTHVQDSTYRNNLLYDNLAGGMVFYYDTGGESHASKRNRIFNNTVYFRPSQGRWALTLSKSATDALVKNNIFYGGRYGTVYVDPSSLPGLITDNNVCAAHPGQVLLGNAANDDTEVVRLFREAGLSVGDSERLEIDPDSWRKAGFDVHSLIGKTPLFAGPETGDFRLLAGSVGIDAGADLGPLVQTDILGTPRPQGEAYDCGCYEMKTGE